MDTSALQSRLTTFTKFITSPFSSTDSKTSAKLTGWQNLMKDKLYAAESTPEFLAGAKNDDFIRDHLSYYVMPDHYNQTNFFWTDDVDAKFNLRHLQTCALAQPFMSYLSLNSTYTQAVPVEAYIGFIRSGLMCSWTLAD